MRYASGSKVEQTRQVGGAPAIAKYLHLPAYALRLLNACMFIIYEPESVIAGYFWPIGDALDARACHHI
jgi:hypothetical protein